MHVFIFELIRRTQPNPEKSPISMENTGVTDSHSPAYISRLHVQKAFIKTLKHTY
jgi:hypothetical protein